ncbi:MAG: hypothetical protein D6679_05415 [Candidatus Hydrogenedentota bacterium]|nr:MAG: hypothetical protein D6679_05415 [Candidatus Hydrogenedentota bacterium]
MTFAFCLFRVFRVPRGFSLRREECLRSTFPFHFCLLTFAFFLFRPFRVLRGFSALNTLLLGIELR